MKEDIKEIILTKVQDMSYDLAEEIKNAVPPPSVVEEFKRNVKEKLDELCKCSK